MNLILPVLGGLIVVSEGILYIRGIVKGNTRPHPFTWGLWTVLGTIGFVAAIFGGGGIGLIPLGTLAVEDLFIFIFTLRYLHLHKDQEDNELVSPWLLVIATVGVIAWLLSNEPALAAIGVVIADSMGLLPTFKKTWRDPRSEPTWLWVASAIAMGLGIISLQHFTLASTLFPVYVFAANCSIIALTLRRTATI